MASSLTYTWEFPKFNVQPAVDSLTNVVYSIDWILYASDGRGHGEQVSGTLILPTPDPLTFTPFEYLTQPQVESWVIETMGSEFTNLKTLLQEKIEKQVQPFTTTLSKPW